MNLLGCLCFTVSWGSRSFSCRARAARLFWATKDKTCSSRMFCCVNEQGGNHPSEEKSEKEEETSRSTPAPASSSPPGPLPSQKLTNLPSFLAPLNDLDLAVGQAAVAPFVSKDNFTRLFGPEAGERPQASSDLRMVAQTITTYPLWPGRTDLRFGDPVADAFLVRDFGNRVLSVLTDGCGWGPKPCNASRDAILAFSNYIEQSIHMINTVRDAGDHLLKAMNAAHDAVLARSADRNEVGTTTLVGTLLLPLQNQGQWILIAAAVGDAKVFVFDRVSATVRDLTSGNRPVAADATDPGGRLGPQLKGGLPDLRNLRLYHRFCAAGDMMVLLSDGVHDNLDPQWLGLVPSTVDKAAQALPGKWDEIPEADRASMKDRHREQMLLSLIREQEQKSDRVVQQLMEHCVRTTEGSREFFLNGKRLPDDYSKYPGKMDHATAVVLQV